MSIEGQTNAHIGAYVLGDVLGRGGMGVVYRATHVHLGRQVALKLLAPQFSGNDEFRARFLRESRLAASLDHPNVITVYDAGDFNGTLYIAMRCVEGIDLAQLLREQGPLEPLVAVSLLDQVAAALDVAHEHGLVHRDVKPANVMIASGRCYLTDFGLTKQAASAESLSLTRTGSFLGTLKYAAPEQIEGREITAQTDVYALGCVLHECLTGAPPFNKDSEVAMLYAHLSEPPPPPSELRPDLPPAIDAVVAKALAKSPQERYQTCAELMSAARAALTEEAGKTVVAPPPAPPTVLAQPPAPPTEAAPPPAPPTEAAPPPAPRVEAAQPPAGEPSRSREEADTGPLPQTAPTARIQGTTPTAPYVDAAGGTGVAEAAGPAAPPGRGGSRRLLLLLAGGAAVVAAVIVGVVVITGGSSGKHTPPASHTSTQPSSPAAVRPLSPAAIIVGNSPDGMAHRGLGGSFYIANAGDGTISQVDESGRVHGAPFRYASHSGAGAPINGWQGDLWVGDYTGGRIDQIDPSTWTAIGHVDVRGHPYATTIADETKTFPGYLWVANDNNTLVQLAPGNGSAGATEEFVQTASGPKRMTELGNTLFVANENEGTVTEINATTRVVGTPIHVGMHPAAISATPPTGGSPAYLWLADRSQDAVTRFTVGSGTLNQTGSPIPVGKDPARMTVGSHSLYIWVSNSGDGTVTRINQRTGRVDLPPIKVGGYPDALTAHDGVLWVTIWSRPNPQFQGPPGGVVRINEDSGRVRPG